MTNFTCFLIGPNGAGKTTVGRMLANFLSVKFVDTEEEIDDLFKKNIMTIWQKDKQQEIFNTCETTLLHNVTKKQNIVVATSVTSIQTLNNRQLLGSKGTTIYLHTDPINQYTRSMLSSKQSRLLANVDNKLQFLVNLFKKIDPLYKSIADFIVSTDTYSIEEVVNKIIDYLYCGLYC